MKKVYLIHGWEGNPENAWFPWLKTSLEKKGFSVEAPAMPNPDEPEINAWVGKLVEVIQPDEQTVLIGHSVGCQAILRYLEKTGSKVDKVILVAPWMSLNPEELEDEETVAIAKPWLETPIDWLKVKTLANKFVAIFSTNDPFVPLSEKEIFAEKLGAEIVVEENKGHFDDEVGVLELSCVLNSIVD
jgi:hypothetical protein